MIAAIGRDTRAIGKDNRLLWDIPEDMKRFRTLTSGHAVIMGQKTYESIGRPLPNRTNIVLTQDPTFQVAGVVVCYSIEEALERAREYEREEVFVIGGGTIYRQFLPLSDRLYLTLVDGDYEADTFFPEYGEFARITESGQGESGGCRYEFVTLERV